MAYERARVTMDDPLPSPIHYKVMIFPLILANWSIHDAHCIYQIYQSILKKTVTMHQAPSAVYHYTDSGGSSDVPPSKVGAIFQAAKKDLLGIIQLQVSGRSNQFKSSILISLPKTCMILHSMIIYYTVFDSC